MKTPRTVLNEWVLIFRAGLLWAIVLLLGLLAVSWLSKASAGAPPDIPPIQNMVRWEIEQVPRNVTVVWPNGLQMAFPIKTSGHFTHPQAFKETDDLWYFRDACTSYTRIVWPSPTMYRWGDYQDWLPYIHKTYTW